MIKTGKKSNFNMAYLFMITYLASYVTRINYGAVISEMASQTNFSKALLSMALTGSFISYGAGQIVSGRFGDKIQPKSLVFYGLLVTSAMNIFIPFCRSPYQMTAVWFVNGFAQAFMWPPIVKLMSAIFTDEEYKKASVIVSWGSSFGTILVYFAAPIIISVANWKAMFAFSAACGILMACVWQKLCVNIEMSTSKRKIEEKPDAKTSRLFTPTFYLHNGCNYTSRGSSRRSNNLDAVLYCGNL